MITLNNIILHLFSSNIVQIVWCLQQPKLRLSSIYFLLPFVVGPCKQTLALLLRLLALSGMAKLELPRLLLTSGMSRLLVSRLLSQTTSCNLCHFWIWVFWFFITSSQWSLPVPRANMNPPRTVNPRGLSANRTVVFLIFFHVFNLDQNFVPRILMVFCYKCKTGSVWISPKVVTISLVFKSISNKPYYSKEDYL